MNREFAALDLGSNSFHLIIAVDDVPMQIVNRYKETVRLGEGLDTSHTISPAASTRALDCLGRIHEQLKHIPTNRVRAVGTSAMRRAENSTNFLVDAEASLGVPIEIIAGREEARLIYSGVQLSIPADSHRRLVIDIGGGSTEVIVGDANELHDLESLEMGCIRFTERFFADGKIGEVAMAAAEAAARELLLPCVDQLTDLHAYDFVGSSGTVRAIANVVADQGWCDGDITLQAMQNLRRHLIESRSVDRINQPALSEDRRPVFTGGVAILSALFSALDIEHLQVSEGALREGVLLDLMSRDQA